MKEKRKPKKFVVEYNGLQVWIRGLSDGFGCEDTAVFYRYESGDIGTPRTKEHMLGALYDLYQVSDYMIEGDRFSTEFGEATAFNVHVLWSSDLMEAFHKDPKEFPDFVWNMAGAGSEADEFDLPYLELTHDGIEIDWLDNGTWKPGWVDPGTLTNVVIDTKVLGADDGQHMLTGTCPDGHKIRASFSEHYQPELLLLVKTQTKNL